MREDIEIIRAGSLDKALEVLFSLYPRLDDWELVARRNDAGKFSKTGHTFQFWIRFEEDEPTPEELGEDEY